MSASCVFCKKMKDVLTEGRNAGNLQFPFSIYNEEFSLIFGNDDEEINSEKKNQGHQLCTPLIEQVEDGGCVSHLMQSP